jgi:hypothetical protein
VGQGVPPFDAVWEITLTADNDQTVPVVVSRTTSRPAGNNSSLRIRSLRAT